MTTQEPVQSGGIARFIPPKMRKLVAAYAVAYAVLFVSFLVFVFTGKVTMTPEVYVERGFPNAAAVAADGLRDIITKEAHIRIWSHVPPFEDIRGVRYHFEAGQRLTDHQAVALAQAILADRAKAEADRTIKPIDVYNDGGDPTNNTFVNLPWPYMFNVMNLIGMYLFLAVALAKPISGYLNTTAAETRDALLNAKKMAQEAQDLKKQYEHLIAEVETEKKRLAGNAGTEFAEEREHILHLARHEAQTMLANLKAGIDAEVAASAAHLKTRIADEALRGAREIVQREVADADHESALAQFTSDLKKADLA